MRVTPARGLTCMPFKVRRPPRRAHLIRGGGALLIRAGGVHLIRAEGGGGRVTQVKV